VKAPGTKLINLIVHDTASGLSLWSEAPDSEVYGCIVYNNGWEGADRPHGHGIYSQNSTGKKTFKDNIVFNQFDKGIQIYGSSAAELRNFLVEGNTAFNAGLISLDRGSSENMVVAGGSNGPDEIVIQNNYFYGNELKGALGIGGDRAKDLIFRDNYVSHLSRFKYWATATVTGNTFVRDTSMIELYTTVDATSLPYNWEKNTFHSRELKYTPFGYYKSGSSGKGLSFGGWQQTTRFDDASTYVKARPTGAKVFVRPNQYQPGRGHVTVFNWNLSSTVSVDVGSILSSGQSYEVRNAQNYFASPVLTGTYNGSPLNIPMNGLSAATPVGLSTPPSTGPEFNVFVVQAMSSATAPAAATPANTVPTISSISNQTIAEDGATSAISFTISDSITSSSSLGLVGSSSNPTLVPNANIKFGGSASSRTVTVTPTPDKSGLATITISVTDGSLIATRLFSVTVTEVNDAPEISAASDLSIETDGGSASGSFSVSDEETSSGSLSVIGSSSNPALVPNSNVICSGTSGSRTVLVKSVAGAYGTATITLRVSDGERTDSTSFNVTVSKPLAPYVAVELEAGRLTSPMVITSSSGASAGGYVTSATVDQGSAVVTVNVPKSGEYAIWCRVLGRDGNRDSMFVSVDGGAEDIYDMTEGLWSSAWQWTPVNGRAGGRRPLALNPRVFTLSAGAHTITFRGREPGAGLDRIIVTSDPAFVPSDDITGLNL
jgi:hypothetical protein